MADPLTAEQRALWDELKVGERPTRATAGQTLEQAENFQVASFRFCCAFEGIPAPDETAIREALRAAEGKP